MGVCVFMNLGAVSREMSAIPVKPAVGAEVSIHTFGAIGVGMLSLLRFMVLVSIYSQFQPCSLCILLQHMMMGLQVVEGVH